MIKKLASIALLLTVGYNAMAQSASATVKSRRPDIPGTFTVDIGVNRLTDKPNNLKYGFWGSRTINLYYFYDTRIGKSKFTFHPGIGLGMDRFKLIRAEHYTTSDTITRNNPTLAFDNLGNTTFVDAAHYIYDSDTLNQIDWSGSYSTKKSMVALNYLDIPIEVRFNTNPDDPARSFKVAVGGRIGYLLGSHTKIKYKEDGELKKLKTNQNYNLNPFRYSVYMKVYLGNFSLFGYYNLNTMFKDNKGPSQTQTSYYTVGISLSSF
jgi:hypothetical protein